MASSKNRQRALARAKAERQIARRAAQARRRRQRQAAISSGLALVVLVLGIVWVSGGFDSKPEAAADCLWKTDSGSTNTNLREVGTPPTKGIDKTGTKPMTITTNLGEIKATLDIAKARCTVESFTYLAGKKFFDNTKCHRMTTTGLYVLQCGDPSATGQGGPSYTFADEGLPTTPASPSADPAASTPASPVASSAPASPGASGSAQPSASPSAKVNLYNRGVLAMANSGPDTNGSQFFIVYGDSPVLDPKYTVFGVVTSGLELIDKVAAAGVVDAEGKDAQDGAPKTEVRIQSLTVGQRSNDPVPSLPGPSGSTQASAAPTGAPASAAASASTKP